MSRPSFLTPARIIIGTSTVAWVTVALASPWHTLAEDASRAVSVALLVWGWALWTLVMVALLVPSPAALTAVRCISPLAVVVAIVATSPVAVFGAVLACVVSFSALFADVMVQGGAYGEERRFALRTPVPQMAPTVIAWAVLVGTTIGGTLLLCAARPVAGVPLTAVGAVLCTRVPRLLHRHSRRWLVVVPAGIVLHDHLVLAETVMSPRSKVARIDFVREAGETADFTGGVAGERLAVHLRESDKIVLSPITARILKTTEALHVRAFSIAPRRLQAARAAITL